MNTELLIQRVEKLKKRPGANAVTIDAIKDWLLESTLLQRIRINPYSIAREHGISRRSCLEGDAALSCSKIVSEFLYGLKEGLFDLHWDVHCPHCNMIVTEFNDLAEASALSFCEMCDREFEVDFLERVEVTFSLNKEIEDPKLCPVCPPPPILKCKFQLVTRCNETDSAVVSLPEGRYRYCCPITLAKGILLVEGEEAKELQEVHIQQLPGKYFDKQQVTIRPGKVKVELTNIGHQLSGMILHSDGELEELTLDKLPPRLSGLEIIHHHDYKRLMGKQVLSRRERIKIRAVTIMFTDIIGSTRMYETLGDAKAYNIVRDHFDILFQAIEQHGGTVIKTIGDAVMASFVSNGEAIKAAGSALEGFKKYNKTRHRDEQVNVKIGIHRGSAVLVNMNNHLDYFGSMVNKAVRLQDTSQSYEISFSQEIFNDKSALAALRSIGVVGIQEHLEDLKGIDGSQVVYTARIGKEDLISIVNVLI